MRLFCTVLAVLVVLVIAGGTNQVLADQNDVRLDTLFGKLQKANSRGEANEITQQIWVVWTEVDDETAHEAMLQGIESLAQSEFDTALAIFSDVISAHPTFAEAWNKRATVYYLMGRLEESMADVEVTLDLEPRHFGALSGKGLILMAKGEFLPAIEAFEHALKTNPHMPSIHTRIEMLKDVLKKNET